MLDIMKIFITVVKWLVIPAFFVIANTSNLILANVIAVCATIVVIANYLFEYVEKQKT